MTFDREVEDFLKEHPDLEQIEVLMADMNGIYRGKKLPADNLDKVAENKIYFPISVPFLTTNGATPDEMQGEYGADPDRPCPPVLGSLQIIPWEERKTAQVQIAMCELDGSPMAFDPRYVLQRTLDAFKKDGLTPVVALEYEFFLFEAGSVPPVPVAPLNGMPRAKGANCYSKDVFYDYEELLQEIGDACAIQGIEVSGLVCEYGEGQFEVNLNHSDDAMDACDEAMMLKRVVKGVARKHGMLASFMAKPFTDDVGSGLHAHVSILNENGENVFGLDGGEEILKHAVGGLIETMPDATAFFAPNANSYRRFDPSAYAPIVPNWGENNRRVSVRLPMSDTKNRRFEHRVSGADACPYLVLASILAGAHHGIKNKVDPGEKLGEFDDVDYTNTLPRRWRHALDTLAKSTVMTEYLGEGFMDIYLKMKNAEEEEFHRAVTSVDYAQYLRLI